jgi:hypothetical protein
MTTTRVMALGRRVCIGVIAVWFFGCAELLVALEQKPPPQRVSITLVGAMIGTKPGGDVWDGWGQVKGFNADLIRLIGTASGFGQETRLALQLSNFFNGIIDAPDVGGVIEVFSEGKRSELIIPTAEDQMRPRWRGLKFKHVVLDDTFSMRITLTDSDFDANDPIDTIFLTSTDFREALKKREVYDFHVSDQLLYVLVRVAVE